MALENVSYSEWKMKPRNKNQAKTFKRDIQRVDVISSDHMTAIIAWDHFPSRLFCSELQPDL